MTRHEYAGMMALYAFITLMHRYYLNLPDNYPWPCFDIMFLELPLDS